MTVVNREESSDQLILFKHRFFFYSGKLSKVI